MPKKIYLSEVMMPSQTNPSGNVHGGELMKMMDSTAYAVARKYCHANVVTARVDIYGKALVKLHNKKLESKFFTPIFLWQK